MPTTFRVRVQDSGGKRVAGTISVTANFTKQIRTLVDAALVLGANKALLFVSNRAKTRARKKTHAMERSITIIPATVSGNKVSGAVTAGGIGAPYAVVQDSGSGLWGPKRAKYIIRPKTRKALAFPGFGMGVAGGPKLRLSGSTRVGVGTKGMVVRKFVRHPGVRPDHFLTQAALGVEDQIEALVQAEVDRALGVHQ